MNRDTQLADKYEEKRAAIENCNKVARKLLAEVNGFTKKNAEQLLSADIDRVTNLTLDLSDARAQLAQVSAEAEALLRRRD